MEHQLLGNRSLSNGPMLHSLKNIWKNIVADMSFVSGDRAVLIETSAVLPKIATDGKWVEIAGKSSKGNFRVYLLSDFCLAMMQAFCPELQVDALDGNKAAIVIEHSLTNEIAAFENTLGSDLHIESVQDVQQMPVGDLLGLEFDDGQRKWPGALSIGGELLERVEGLAGKFANETERNLDPRMFVHLGPVVLPARQAFLISQGATIDCGVQPNDVIKGFLLRSDNCYWPVYIEDELIQISGDLAGPIDPSTIPSGQVFATFGIGEVTLTAAQRSKLTIGSQAAVARYPSSAADIYYQAIPYGSGTLMLLNENLGISVEKIGDAVNRNAFDPDAKQASEGN